MTDQSFIEQLERRLATLECERTSLIDQIESLKNASHEGQSQQVKSLGSPVMEVVPTSSSEKINLFLKLFRCRESVFAKRWENSKTEKSGYAPVCQNEWVKPICQKPKIKCADCAHQKFSPLNETAIEAHLKGVLTVGTYTILENDNCVFLACDFDEKSWRKDVLAYAKSAEALGIQASIEISRSGNGAHAWIFFQESVPARLARSLGTLILSKCSELDIRSTLSSYDRFFPSQDYLPKGGFGNLIALPLQKWPRESGSTCFVDENLNIYRDQWAFLSQVRRISPQAVRDTLKNNIGLRVISKDREGFQDISWNTDCAILESEEAARNVRAPLKGKTIEIGLGSMISIQLEGLPKILIHKLKRLASFPNPKFYELQRMRLQTYPHPRFMFSGELREEMLLLPRGLLDKVFDLIKIAGAEVILRDERIARKKIKLVFGGTLNESQEEAVKNILKSDIGVLSAPPGAGKTVMACALIARRSVSTLILVHRQQILEQWKEHLQEFLGIPVKEIGVWGGTKKRSSGRIDLAMLQTLTKSPDLSNLAEKYSQIIIDECHHIPASSFEDVMKQLPARYVIGLTATPYRKDGLEKILFHQCGPIRHEIKTVDGGVLTKVVRIFETGFRVPDDLGVRPPYHALLHVLTNDDKRNLLICEKTLALLRNNSFPLLISDRKDHLDLLGVQLKDFKLQTDQPLFEIIRLDGDVSNKQRRIALEEAKKFRKEKRQVLLMATGSLIGEGFDLPELDALILATPLSFEGRMIQYAGRIHRLVEGKDRVEIVDFVDSHSAMLLKMCKSRMRTYKQMEYSIRVESNESTQLFGTLSHQNRPTGFFQPSVFGRI
ncbi:MAG: type restriction enzyme res subunit [Bacteriovoracaceae bacterium]|nr:type restriction enzyme res subunit [Bacteriovoracaceae bacterium]